MNTAFFTINGKLVELYVDDQGRPFIAMAKKRPPLGMAGDRSDADKQFEDGTDFEFQDGPEYEFQNT